MLCCAVLCCAHRAQAPPLVEILAACCTLCGYRQNDIPAGFLRNLATAISKNQCWKHATVMEAYYFAGLQACRSCPAARATVGAVMIDDCTYGLVKHDSGLKMDSLFRLCYTLVEDGANLNALALHGGLGRLCSLPLEVLSRAHVCRAVAGILAEASARHDFQGFVLTKEGVLLLCAAMDARPSGTGYDIQLFGCRALKSMAVGVAGGDRLRRAQGLWCDDAPIADLVKATLPLLPK